VKKFDNSYNPDPVKIENYAPCSVITSAWHWLLQIEAGAEIQMECILLFMLPGNYHVRLHRSSLDDVIGDGRSQTSEVTFNYHRYSPTLRVNALP